MDGVVFHNLLRKHRDRVFSHAWYVLRNREDAEDVTQEVFVKLWEHGKEIDPGKTEAWIMRVTHNACIDCCRRRSRKQKRQRDLEAEGAADAAAWRPQEWDPEGAFEWTETQRILLSAMDELPASVRSLLLMHYFQDMPMDRIGEAVGMSESAVKVAVHRGRKKLKKALIKRNPEWSRRIGYVERIVQTG